ncbi:MAG: hypothetical protein ACHREM_06535 [Polyangiales bacterium]
MKIEDIKTTDVGDMILVTIGDASPWRGCQIRRVSDGAQWTVHAIETLGLSRRLRAGDRIGLYLRNGPGFGTGDELVSPKRIGFWAPANGVEDEDEDDEDEDGRARPADHPEDQAWPDVRTMIDPSWDAAERALVAAHLRAGWVTEHYFGDALCRICGGKNGGSEQTDGVYLWPTGFVHYIEAHHVKPPVDFIAHVITKTAENARNSR